MEYKHTYCAYWLQQHLNYISSSSYSHCISDMNKKSEQICNKYISSLLTSNSNKFEKHNAIYGGGRHQDSVNGDIVYNFADFFEDKKDLDEEDVDSEDFDESDFNDNDTNNIINIDNDIDDEKLVISQNGNEYTVSSKV